MTPEPVTERTGTLERDAGGFVLRQGGNVCTPLLLQRVPVDLVEKQVVVTGIASPDGCFHADAIRAG